MSEHQDHDPVEPAGDEFDPAEKAPDLTSYGTVGGTTDEDLAAWAERQRWTPDKLEEMSERLERGDPDDEAYFDRLEQNLPPWALNVAQAAEELGVSEKEVRALIAGKQLGAIAGRIVTRGALASYIRRREGLEAFVQPELGDPWTPRASDELPA